MTTLGTALRLLAGSLLVTLLAVVAGWAAVTLLPTEMSVLAIAVVSVIAEAVVCLAGLLLLTRRWPARETPEVAAALSFPVLIAAVTLFGTAGPWWFGVFAAVAVVGGSLLGLRLGSNRAHL